MRVNAIARRTPSALWANACDCADLAEHHLKAGCDEFAIFWMKRASYYETLYWQAFDTYHDKD